MDVYRCLLSPSWSVSITRIHQANMLLESHRKSTIQCGTLHPKNKLRSLCADGYSRYTPSWISYFQFTKHQEPIGRPLSPNFNTIHHTHPENISILRVILNILMIHKYELFFWTYSASVLYSKHGQWRSDYLSYPGISVVTKHSALFSFLGCYSLYCSINGKLLKYFVQHSRQM